MLLGSFTDNGRVTYGLDLGKTESDHRGYFVRLRLFELDKSVVLDNIVNWIRFVAVE